MTNLVLPKGILFDFDGIIVHSREINGWDSHIAANILRALQLGSDNTELTIERIATDLVNATRAVSHWCNATSLETHPHELADEMWIEYLTVNWPRELRDRLRPRAREIVCQISQLRYERTYRDGTRELLSYLADLGIGMAIVSNTPCGEVTRNYLREEDLSHFFQTEIYSNEVGLRKPNPDILLLGVDALSLNPNQTWFVGDRLDRDTACGVRAGVAKTVLMESSDTSLYPYELSLRPDIVVADPYELLALIQSLTDGLLDVSKDGAQQRPVG